MAVFLREPSAGRVKTRLAASIGPAAAVALYTSMLADTLARVRELAGDAGVLVHDGEAPAAYPAPWQRLPQRGADLGARLRCASLDLDRSGCFPLVFLGSDSPDLPAEHLSAAMRAVRSADLALGSTPDGGVWCIGLRRACVELFEGIPWSSPQTGQALRNRAEQLELKRVELAPWQDVDELSDLLALAQRLRSDPNAAPCTQRWLVENQGLWQTRPGLGVLGEIA